MNTFTTDFAGLVLAGGQSLRMGTDKSYLKFQNITFLERAHHCLITAGIQSIYVSGKYPDFFCVEDRWPMAGPSAAILSALFHPMLSNKKALIIVPVDMPLLPPGRLLTLIKTLNETPTIESCFFDPHPLPCAFTINALRRILPYYQANPAIPIKLLLTEHVKYKKLIADNESENNFLNVNTPVEFSLLRENNEIKTFS